MHLALYILPSLSIVGMDASSSSMDAQNLGEMGELRYRNKVCRCGQRCVVKITESNEKSNKGKLFFVCPNGTCKFWSWCKPISAISSSTSAGSQAPNERNVNTAEQVTENFERICGDINELQNKYRALRAHSQNCEAKLEIMKILGIASLALSVLSLVVAFGSLVK